VRLMSIGMPGGSARDGACIAAGVVAVGVCECKGNPNSLDEQLFSQDLVRENLK
jgi:hypothetical protein